MLMVMQQSDVPDPLNLPTFTYPESPRRIPKLKVRKRIEETTPPLGLGLCADEIAPVSPTIVQASPTSPSIPLWRSAIPPTQDVSSRPPMSSPQLSWSSRDSMPGSPEPVQQQTKKSRAVFSFFSVKEPSTAAWEQYVQESKAQAGLKGARPTSLINKKLPDNVPKVNSKWHGMPNHAPQPSKTSLDIGSFIRGPSRASGETARSTRPSTGKSSASGKVTKQSLGKDTSQTSTGTSSLRRPSRPTTAQRVKSDETSRHLSRHPTTDSSQGRSTAMSTRSTTTQRRAPSPPLPEAIPEMSLFFPPEATAEPGSVNILLNNAQSRDYPAEQIQPVKPDSHQIQIKDKSDTMEPLQLGEELPNVPAMVSDSQDVTASQHDDASSPLTPPDFFISASAPPSQIVGSPNTKHFRSVDEIPQWPLPTSPHEVIIDPDDPATEPNAGFNFGFSIKPPIPPKALRRSSSSSIERLSILTDTQSSVNRTSPVITTPTFSASPIHSRPLITTSASPGPSVPDDDAAPPPPAIRLTRLLHPSLRAPALLPGRVMTRDTDLATIPESDAASLASRNSMVFPPHPPSSSGSTSGSGTTTTSFDSSRTETGGQGTARSSGDDSRASSEMSAQWYLSPRERLGLGGLIKRGARDGEVPWPLVADEEVPGGVGVVDAARAAGKRVSTDSTTLGALGSFDAMTRVRRKSALKGVFKR